MRGGLVPDTPLPSEQGHAVTRLLQGGLFRPSEFLPRRAGPRTPRLQGHAGSYLLGELLGAGERSVVHLARDISGRPVAVKHLRCGAPASLQALERELRCRAQLGGDSRILPVLDRGLAEGRPFLVLPWADGETLADLLRSSSLTVSEAIAVGRGVAWALAQTHARGLAHLDLDPHHVLFVQGTPCLSGMSRARELAGGPAPASAARAGWRYRPPEPRLDARADVWAVGALMVECLTGAAPQRGATARRALRARGDVPRWLIELLAGCLASAPADRHPDAQALWLDLAAGAPAAAPAAPGLWRGGARVPGVTATVGALARLAGRLQGWTEARTDAC